jgi:hypothetical protein
MRKNSKKTKGLKSSKENSLSFSKSALDKQVNLKKNNHQVTVTLAFTITLILTLVCTFLFFYRSTSSTIFEGKTFDGINVTIKIVHPDFNINGTKSGNIEICNGIPGFPRIAEGKVSLMNNDSQSNGSTVSEFLLGAATSRSNSECIYNKKITALQNFSGGKIKIFAQFQFGKSEDFYVDLGKTKPYRDVDITLNLG